jgi:HEAT repeat protein
VRESLAGDDPRLRSAAASALAVAPTAESLDLHVWIAGSDPDPSGVRAAAEGLRAIALSSTGLRDAAVEALTNLATDDGRRVAALDQLRRLTPDAIPALGRRLSSRDPGIRRVAVHALARASRPDATDYVVQALGDPDPVVRRDAVEALARVGTRGVARTLADMAQNDADDSVRRAARAALRRVPGCAAAIAEPLPDTPGDAPGQGDGHER